MSRRSWFGDQSWSRLAINEHLLGEGISTVFSIRQDLASVRFDWGILHWRWPNRTQEVQFQNIPGELAAVSGEPKTSDDQRKSVITVPLIFGSTVHGVLTLFLGQSHSLSERERDAFGELVDMDHNPRPFRSGIMGTVESTRLRRTSPSRARVRVPVRRPSTALGRVDPLGQRRRSVSTHRRGRCRRIRLSLRRAR